jgi:hypothetical protein
LSGEANLLSAACGENAYKFSKNEFHIAPRKCRTAPARESKRAPVPIDACRFSGKLRYEQTSAALLSTKKAAAQSRRLEYDPEKWITGFPKRSCSTKI